MTTITLEPWEYEHATLVGARRYTANWTKQDAAHYDRSRMEDDRTAQVAATICELAVAKWTNRYWSGAVWHHTEHNQHRNEPDVGRNIEVKRIRTRREATVRKHQVGKGLVLFVAEITDPEFREVIMHGWLPYDQAWEHGTPLSDPTRINDRLIHINKLNKELP